jgi:hypothetical protein
MSIRSYIGPFLASLSLLVLLFASVDLLRAILRTGKIVAIRLVEKSGIIPVHTDSQGKSVGGVTTHHPFHVYRVETPNRFFEFQENGKSAHFAMGQEIRFRIEKKSIFTSTDGKERKYNVTDVEQK